MPHSADCFQTQEVFNVCIDVRKQTDVLLFYLIKRYLYSVSMSGFCCLLLQPAWSHVKC